MRRVLLTLGFLGAYALGAVTPHAAAASNPFDGIERELRAIRSELHELNRALSRR